MSILSYILWSIFIALFVITTPVLLWQAIIGAFGLLPMKKRTVKINKKHRFAVIICARNEETVIGNLIDSLMAQNYSRNMFDVFVAADNCTDNTAVEARNHGTIVYERFDYQHVGKGFAMKWLLDKIQKNYPAVYDAVTVFDADNLVDVNFLNETNKALCTGADVARGYLHAKNLGDSWVTNCYAIYWMVMMRFFHRGRANFGLSCYVNGTGFSFKMDLIRNTGWNTQTLVEDCEFSMQQITKGRKIVPVYSAAYYDEQPISFALSITQRFRWTVGCVQCIKYCLPEALKAFTAKEKTRPKQRMDALDVIFYLLLIPCVALSLIGGVIGFAALLLGPVPKVIVLYSLIVSVLWGWFSLTGGALLVLLLEKQPIRPMLSAVFLFPVFVYSMAFMAIFAVFCPKTEWKPIEHTGGKNINDIKKEIIMPQVK